MPKSGGSQPSLLYKRIPHTLQCFGHPTSNSISKSNPAVKNGAGQHPTDHILRAVFVSILSRLKSSSFSMDSSTFGTRTTLHTGVKSSPCVPSVEKSLPKTPILRPTCASIPVSAHLDATYVERSSLRRARSTDILESIREKSLFVVQFVARASHNSLRSHHTSGHTRSSQGPFMMTILNSDCPQIKYSAMK